MTAAVALSISACTLDDDKPVETSASQDQTTSVQPEQPDVGDTAESVQVVASAAACPLEYFCAYSGPGLTGSQLLKTKGNWSGSKSNVKSVINHGKALPGFDHVELTWHVGTQCKKRCVHYYPGPGTYKFDLGNVPIDSVTWRGECAHGEDVEQACCPGCQ
jgi:hypothetical protein